MYLIVFRLVSGDISRQAREPPCCGVPGLTLSSETQDKTILDAFHDRILERALEFAPLVRLFLQVRLERSHFETGHRGSCLRQHLDGRHFHARSSDGHSTSG